MLKSASKLILYHILLVGFVSHPTRGFCITSYSWVYIYIYIFQAAVVTIQLCGCTTWMLTKRIEKKLDGNYTRMLRTILNKSWRQHPTKQQLYGHQPPMMKTIKIRRTRHCWRRRDVLIRDVLLWTPSHRRAKAGRPARTYIQQFCANSGWRSESLQLLSCYFRFPSDVFPSKLTVRTRR